MQDIIVRLSKFPCKIKGFTALDDEGNYNVYINDCLSNEAQKKTYLHEVSHINENHWDYDVRVDKIESETH